MSKKEITISIIPLVIIIAVISLAFYLQRDSFKDRISAYEDQPNEELINFEFQSKFGDYPNLEERFVTEATCSQEFIKLYGEKEGLNCGISSIIPGEFECSVDLSQEKPYHTCHTEVSVRCNCMY